MEERHDHSESQTVAREPRNDLKTDSKKPRRNLERKPRLLVIEDDPDLSDVLVSYFSTRGYEMIHYVNPERALIDELESLRPTGSIDVVLTDLRLPGMDGMEFIQRLKRMNPHLPILLMTAHSSVEVALRAIESGAFDFAVKPLHFPQLAVSVERALHFHNLERENVQLRSAVQSKRSGDGMIGRSPKILAVAELAKRVSSSLATVLIQGESGSGKEVVANLIHRSGSRKDQPFVAINCSAIPETLLESELFGYGKGAFTGANDKKVGLFEEANQGTLFLDEIGDLSLPLQAKLLRVLQERKIKRVGENQYRNIDVRVIVATHKDLQKEVREGRFREDLFFRLNVIPINIPPLRDRKEDILLLAEHFLSLYRGQNQNPNGVPIRGFSLSARQRFLELPWRGNVRELENAIERAVVLCGREWIEAEDLPLPPHLLGGQKEQQDEKAYVQASSQASLPESYPVPQDLHDLESESELKDLKWSPPSSLHSEPASTVYGQSSIPPQGASSARSEPASAEEGWFLLPRDLEDLPSLDELVLAYLHAVLKRTGGVKEKAAKVLRIDRKTLFRRFKEEQIRKNDHRQETSEMDANSVH